MSDTAVNAAAAAQRLREERDAMIGQHAAVRGAHSLVWVRGADAMSFLDGLISQAIGPAEPGSARRSLLLTPQGKMRAFLWVLRGADDEVGLVTQAVTSGTVVEDLTRFRFRVEAEIEPDTGPTLTLVGPTAEEALLAADLPRPGAGWLPTSAGLVASVPFPESSVPRFVLVGDAATAITQSAIDASLDSYMSVRIAAGEPLGNVDFDDSTIAHELGPVDDAVDFTKGCYLGQELVARIDSRGRVTKRLRIVTAHGDEPQIAGAVLFLEGKEVGTVTSAAPWIDGASIGLARVHHEVEDGQTVEAAIGDRRLKVTIKAPPLLGS